MGGWNYEALEFWLTLAVVVVSAVGGWIARAIRRNARRIAELEDAESARNAEIREEARREIRAIELELKGQVGRHESEISALKAAQITHEDLGRIYQRLEPIGSELGEVKGGIEALSTQLGIVTQHLLAKE